MKKAKKYVYFNLVFGLIWLAAGIVRVMFQGHQNWFGFIWFILAAFYIGVFIYQIRKLKKEKDNSE